MDLDQPLAAVDAVHRHHIHHHLQHADRHNIHEPPLSPSHHQPTIDDGTTYKQRKEAWIADQTGSSIHLVNTLGLVMLLTYAIWAVLRAKRIRFVRAAHRLEPSQLGNSVLASLVAAAARVSDWQLEFLILIVPAVGAHTVLATHLLATNGVLLAVLMLLIRSDPPLSFKSNAQQADKQKRHWSKKYSDDEDQDQFQYQDEAEAEAAAKRTSPLASNASASSEAELPFRVSIDSAADAAHAAAAPPNFYDGPGSSLRSDPDASVDAMMSTAPQSPVLVTSASGSSAFRSSESAALLSPTAASTSASSSSSPIRRSAELTALKTSPMQLLHSRDGSDAQSVVSASSAMSPLARSVVDPWGKARQPCSSSSSSSSVVDHSPSFTEDQSCSMAASTSLRSPTIDANLFVRPQPFLTVYRAHMMLVTIISILAVDFPVFPRSLSKCESWGTSWMDMGVGSFVFSLGIVSALPLLKSPRNRFRPLRQQMVADVRKSLPLLALGSIRVITVKGTEYPEHVGEYGVHWNFFITLGLLPFAATLSRPFAPWLRYSVLGVLLSVSHQAVLQSTGWQSWALSDSVARDTLVTQNKEGLTSMVGYLAIFYIGLDLGHYVLPLDPYFAYRRWRRRRRARARTDKLAMVLASLAIVWWAGYALSQAAGVRTSRRLANLAYVLWVAAFNTSFLLGYVLIYMTILQPIEQQPSDAVSAERMSLPSSSSSMMMMTVGILEDLNRHSLTVFLAANLLTGLVNLTVQTMYVGDAAAVAIVLAYTAACCALARWLTLRGFRLKL